jgi:hypothetical protein
MLYDRLLDVNSSAGAAGRFYISIAGTSYAIITRDKDFLDILRERYHYFETSGPAEYEIILQFLPLHILTNTLVIENAQHLAHASVRRVNSGNNYVIEQATKPFLALANTESKKVLVRMCHSQSSFNSFLRTLFTLVLTEKNGLVLRAAAVQENGEVHIFCHPRNEGKTILAQISPESTVLADGLIVILPHNGHFRVYSTPFQEQNDIRKKPARIKLDAIYFLKRERTNNIITLGGTSVVLSLFRNSTYFTDDRLLLSRILDTCQHVAGAVPAYEMNYCQDMIFLESLR